MKDPRKAAVEAGRKLADQQLVWSDVRARRVAAERIAAAVQAVRV